MNRGHTPYGYRIEKGKAVINQQEAERLRQIYTGYLSGLSLVRSAKAAGLTLTHSSVKLMLQNRRYLGDDFYPQIVEKDLFEAFEIERQRREERWHGRRATHKREEIEVPTRFRMREAEEQYVDPYEQAEYLFSLIEEDSFPADTENNSGRL